VSSHFGVQDHSERAMWSRLGYELDRGDGGQQRRTWEINPVTGVPDDW